MAILTDNWLLDISSILTALIAVFIAWTQWSHTYWSRKNILAPKSTFFFGNSKGIVTQKQSLGDFMIEIYEYIRKHHKPHGGFYLTIMPNYMPVDPEIIKHIMLHDFDHFVDRGVYYNEDVDPLSAHLFSLDGAKWRNLRMKLTPTFTSGKMKMMFDTLVKCSDQLLVEMDQTVGKAPIDIKNILARFTTDIIGSCAFGIDCNSLKNPDDEFTQYLKLFFVEGFWENINGIITFVAPEFAKKLKLRVVNPDLSKFFMKVVQDTVNLRERNNIYRKDFMHLLLQLKNRGKLVDDDSILKSNTDGENKEVTLTLNELAAQAFVFFLAGYETSSTTMTFCLYELASNPEIQQKLRDEINEVFKKHENKLTYNAIMEMRYMDKVVNETLRKYPPLPGLIRICNKKYKVPGTDFVIEKGTKIWIPVLGLHRDPEYYPNPEKFDPERFSEENKRQRHPYTYLPFGEGPRICIGLRFGMMQTKVGLSVLLKNYKFSINSKTKSPLQLDPKSFVMNPEGGIWLDYTRV
ncbi:probable cytochrome P450 6a13 isoform X2 [Tribolium madens]|nr:probable cytochrome P450 6a13 isoform X2 [Tribolium madens]XP_044259567.1 probable cytochrome P450 6a13 isoform X2 [Tribolium madens]XP_044259568.1 probable cytochrome P450 6a13 isoform X2 [Tribolium madens]